jgi:hypothetical protein
MEKTSAQSNSQPSNQASVESSSKEVGSSSNPQPSYPQLPPIPDGSSGSPVPLGSHEVENSEAASSKAKGNAPMDRDPEVLSDAPPLPSSQQTTPPTEPEEPDRRPYIPPDDDWPPEWMDDRKEETSPLLWPLDREGWEKYLVLSTKMASRRLESDELASAIAGSGVWDVSHPQWTYENCWIQWHPDRIQGRIEESHKAIAKLKGRRRLDKDLEDKIVRMSHDAWLSKMPEWSTKS